MTRTAATIACAAALFLAQAALRPAAAGGQAAAPDSSAGVLSWALRPAFVALTWAETQAALDDHRVLDALDRLRVLEAADPAGWQASVFRSHLIAHDLAEREAPDARADRIVEALFVLDLAAARTDDPGPLVAKGQLLLEPRLWERGLSERVERKIGASPRAAAVAALRGASARAPGSRKIQRLVMDAARLAAIDLLMRNAPPAEALALLAEADALAGGMTEDVLAQRLARGWAAVVKAALEADASGIAGAESRFVEVLSEWGRAAPASDDFEALLAAQLARRAVGWARQRLDRGDARGALSLVGLVHTIRSFVAARVDRSRLPLIQDLADRRQLLGFLDDIARQSPDLASSVARLKTLVSAW